MSRRPDRIVGLASFLFVQLWLALLPASFAFSRHGAAVMLEPHTASLLVDYFETFIREKDIEAFHRSVMARYTEGTLGRLTRSESVKARRAAILALGLEAGMGSNEVVARGLRDPDPTVRNLSQNALWAIWFRADTPENNAKLEEIRDLIGRERFEDAIQHIDALLAIAPDFAEAYNQKAIVLFFLEDHERSADACRQVLKRNPYHIGAIAGLGQCYLRLDRHEDALATFRRALKLQPYSESLKQTVEALESQGD